MMKLTERNALLVCRRVSIQHIAKLTSYQQSSEDSAQAPKPWKRPLAQPNCAPHATPPSHRVPMMRYSRLSRSIRENLAQA